MVTKYHATTFIFVTINFNGNFRVTEIGTPSFYTKKTQSNLQQIYLLCSDAIFRPNMCIYSFYTNLALFIVHFSVNLWY